MNVSIYTSTAMSNAVAAIITSSFLPAKGTLIIVLHGDTTEYAFTFLSEEDKALHELSSVLCQCLIGPYRARFIREYTLFSQESLTPDERETLTLRSKELNHASVPGKELIRQEILSVLREFGQLSLEGFFRFRMKSEQAVWKCSVNMLLDEILLQRDYDGFVELMRIFLEVQSPKADVVHLFVRNGSIKIFDEQMHAYDTRQLKEIAKDINAVPVCEDDLSVSILLALAPRSVIIHHHSEEEPPALKTIRKVFSDRISN